MEALGDLWSGLHDVLTGLLHWVEAFAATPYGAWALFVLAFLESSVFPIPPDVLLIALCLGDPGSAFWFAAICAAASVTGGMAGYAIGYYGGRPLVRRLFSPARLRAVESYYDRYNAWATGIAGLTPLPYKLFTISGGAFAINFKIFVLASVLSRTARFMAVAALMFFLGEPAKAFIERYLNLLAILFVILLVLGFWLVGRRAKRIGRARERTESLSTEGRRYLVSGRVQGVSFRYFTHRLATDEGVKGRVRNLPDGRVEAQASGSPEAMERFRRGLESGPPGSRVDEVIEERLSSTPDWESFEIT